MVFSLQGKTALITGAGSRNGIGYATAKILAQMGAGVYLTGLTERVLERAKELENQGFTAKASLADLTDENQVAQLVSKVVSNFGGVDILVNNAGMTSVLSQDIMKQESGSIEEINLNDFKKIIDRNLITAFLTSKFALPHLRKSNNGRIVMVASTTGAVMAMRNDVGYAAAKAGMIGIMRGLALDEARSGITVNAVSPGWIATESQSEKEANEGLATPIGRSATSEEVGATIAFLCASEASYLTGQNIVVDGGNSISEERAN